MPIPVGYAQCNLKFVGTSLPRGAELTFGLDNSAGKTLGQLVTIVANAVSSSHLMVTSHSSCFFAGGRMKLGPDDTGPFVDFTASIAGGASSTPAPANVGFLVKKATALGGHRNAGRWFIPGVPSEAIANGSTVTSAYLTALATECSDFLAALSTAGTPMVLLHTGPGSPTPVTGLYPQTKLGQQHRRLRG